MEPSPFLLNVLGDYASFFVLTLRKDVSPCAKALKDSTHYSTLPVSLFPYHMLIPICT